MRDEPPRSDLVRGSLALLLFAFVALALRGFAIVDQAHASDATPTSTPTARAVAAARNLARSEEAAATDVFTAVHHAATYTATPAPALVGQTMTIPVTVRNFGAGVWSATGSGAVALSYHLYDKRGRLVAWDGLRTELAGDVAPGASTLVDMAFAAPTRSGTYTVETDLVRDG